MPKLVSNIYAAGPSEYAKEQRKRTIQQQSIKAWRERGIAMIPVDDLSSDWDKQAVTNIANRLYGGRIDAGK